MTIVRWLFVLALVAAQLAEGADEVRASMSTRVFKVPFNLREMTHMGDPVAGAAAPADPFAPSTQSPATTPGLKIKTMQKVLEEMGMVFPAGASAMFDDHTWELVVHGTPKLHEVVQMFLDTIMWDGTSTTLVFQLTVVEGPGELIRAANEAATHADDAAPELAQLLRQAQVPDARVRVVGDALVETRSGRRSTIEAVREHLLVSHVKLDTKGRASATPDMRKAGLRLVVEPTIREDGEMLEMICSLNLDSMPLKDGQIAVSDLVSGKAAALPTTLVRGTEVNTGFTTRIGSTRLISVTTPVMASSLKQGPEDTLWAVFLTSKRRLLPPGVPVVAPVRPEMKAPAGMRTVAFTAPEGLLEQLAESGAPLRDWLAAQGITFPSGSTLERHGDTLVMVNTPLNIELFAAVHDLALAQASKTAAFTLHTVQAPAVLLRDLTMHALDGPDVDDAPMLAALQAAVARGEAAFVSSSFLEVESGMRTTHEAGTEHGHLVLSDPPGKGGLRFVSETRNVGTYVELEGTIGAGAGGEVQVDLTHELNVAGPEARREGGLDPESQKHLDMPMTNFHVLRTITSTVLRHGGTRLLALHAPTTTPQASDMLLATLVQCHVVPQVARLPQPPALFPSPEVAASADPKGMITRTMRVPPDFLELNPDLAESADPFAARQPPSPSAGDEKARPEKQRRTAQEILEDVGIPFPEGSAVLFIPATSTLVVRNTRANVDLAEALTDTIGGPHSSATLAFTAQVMEGPGPLLRSLAAQAAGERDHRAELDALLAAVKAGTGRHLATGRMEMKQGVRAALTQGVEHASVTGIALNEKGEAVFDREVRHAGLNVEVEYMPQPYAPRLVGLTLSAEFHTAPPVDRSEHMVDPQNRRLEFPLTDYHRAIHTTSLLIPAGSARLFQLWKPAHMPRDKDVLQVMFITCDLLQTPEE